MGIGMLACMPIYMYCDGQSIAVPHTGLLDNNELTHRISISLLVRPGAVATTVARVSGTMYLMSGATVNARGAVSVESGARHRQQGSGRSF